MQKGSVIAPLLLVVLLAVLAGYYFFGRSPTSDSSISEIRQVLESEKTYTDTNLGFEFKYDKKLTAQEDSEEDFDKRGNGTFRKNFKGYVFYEPGKFLGAVLVLGKDENYETNPFTVWVFDNPENLSIENWYKNFWYYPFVWGDYTSRRENVAPVIEATISGQMAKSGIVGYRPGKPKFVYIQSNGKMYLLRVIGDEGEKILGSFKFL